MTKSENDAAPSFIPYLDVRQHGLRIQLNFDESEKGGMKALRPIEGAGPFAEIIDAAVVGEDGVPLFELFLLVQPDHYPPLGEMASVTNDQVEALWANAFSKQAATQLSRRSAPSFLQKVSAQGMPAAFRSLLYCRHTQQFAEALCPNCGKLLTLCRDDDALSLAGLPAYGQCLERYLYCPACHGASESGLFYTNNLSDPAPDQLQGKAQLIEAYSRLLTRQDLGSALPCADCNEATHCYGPETLVADRMIALFFYPFYMMALPAPTVNSLDFLAMLSGGTEHDIRQQLTRQNKTGRLQRLASFFNRKDAGDGMIFEADQRRFLEVFYLKLSFLKELLDLLKDDCIAVSAPESGFSLESIWVQLPGSGRLPFFWNFSLEIADWVGSLPKAATPKALRKAQTRHFFATAWFYVLLVNGRQGMEVIDKSLASVLDVPSVNISFKEDPVFSSQNLLWDAHTCEPGGQWQELWHKALAIGIALLQASDESGNADSGDDRFVSQIELLREAVHQMLFQPPASQARQRPPSTVEAATQASAKSDEPSDSAADEAIVSILRNILSKMPRSEEIVSTKVPHDDPGELEKTVARVNEDGDYEETVILKQAAVQNVEDQDPAQTVLLDHGPGKEENSKWQEEMAASVAVTPLPGNGVKTPAPEIFEKTVAMHATSHPADASQDLEKTLVINPSEKISASQNAAVLKSPPSATPENVKPAPVDDLPETVIIQPEKGKERKPKP